MAVFKFLDGMLKVIRLVVKYVKENSVSDGVWENYFFADVLTSE